MVEEEDDREDGIGVVKMTLGGFCKDKTASQVQAAVTGLVKLGNVAMAEAYLFANFHISRCLENPAFPASGLPLLDRSFYYRCLLAVTVTNLKDGTLGSEIEASMEAYDLLRPEGYTKADMTPFNQLLTELSIQMATMACNSVWANVERYICRYVKAAHPELKRQGKKIANAVVKSPKVPLDKLFPAASKSARIAGASEVAEKLRGWSKLPSAAQFNSRAHLCMRLFHKILGELNRLNGAIESEQSHADIKNARASSRNAKIRLFNLLPRKDGFTVSYIPITNRTLRVLLRSGSAPLDPSLTGQGDKEDHLPIWRRYFNINAIETRTARFDERFMTDGKGVSIQRRRTCRRDLDADTTKSSLPCDCCASECRVARACPEAKVLEVGVDPGMTDIVTVANSDGVVKSFSSSRFSMEAGYHTSARRVKSWNDETEALVTSIPSSKVASMVELEAHIRVYLSVLPALLASRFTRGYRSMRFFRYNGKQKAIQKVCDLIAPKDRTVVVGFGDWTNNGSGISRPCSGPIREIRHCLKSRPNVLYKNVDEFRTSCTCHGCHSRLSNMKADSVRLRRSKEGETIRKEVKNTKVHKVLHCRNSVGVKPGMARCGATWNRDVNASKNILMLLKLWIAGLERPSTFTRTSKNTVSVRGASFKTPVLTREVGADEKGALSYRPDEQSSEIQA